MKPIEYLLIAGIVVLAFIALLLINMMPPAWALAIIAFIAGYQFKGIKS